jgi:hypothetical protein
MIIFKKNIFKVQKINFKLILNSKKDLIKLKKNSILIIGLFQINYKTI